MKKPLILVTNDDGMFAPGIKALVEVMSELGEVIVVARACHHHIRAFAYSSCICF